ncbi:hypothetical protein BB558_001624 [Smittium angustum]|uniref:H/ACA ribonucleoprotein complex non-core subunit NAF1 n=1 Tax=Smittium angustum TaxID=133377 RepID=A0A2U1JB86_SMIAN|nr:hypothetical protein BB558_001624 [Smittium angustum]
MNSQTQINQDIMNTESEINTRETQETIPTEIENTSISYNQNQISNIQASINNSENVGIYRETHSLQNFSTKDNLNSNNEEVLSVVNALYPAPTKLNIELPTPQLKNTFQFSGVENHDIMDGIQTENNIISSINESIQGVQNNLTIDKQTKSKEKISDDSKYQSSSDFEVSDVDDSSDSSSSDDENRSGNVNKSKKRGGDMINKGNSSKTAYYSDEDMDVDDNFIPTTKNEIIDPKVVELEYDTVPQNTQAFSVGTVHSVVDKTIVVQGNISGERRVLDYGSVLIFDDYTVLGPVFETFGPVKKPLYSILFKSADKIDRERIFVGRNVLCVEPSSQFVATENLFLLKGSDASNLNDEEIAEDEVEFSDDQEESNFRNWLKTHKKFINSRIQSDIQGTFVNSESKQKEPQKISARSQYIQSKNNRPGRGGNNQTRTGNNPKNYSKNINNNNSYNSNQIQDQNALNNQGENEFAVNRKPPISYADINYDPDLGF